MSVIAAAFNDHPVLRGHRDRVTDISYSARLSFLTPETERRLLPLRDAIDAHRAQEARAARVSGFVVPSLGIDMAPATLAGTDAARHADFERQAHEYQQRLRSVLYPIVHRDIANPKPFPSGTYGRLNFTNPDVVPNFSYREPGERGRWTVALTMTAWLILLGVVLGAWAFARARTWPADVP